MVINFNVMMLGILMYFVGLLSFLGNCKHLLSMLLKLEFMVLWRFLLIVRLVRGSLGEEGCLLFFLTMVVCEGRLGLRIHVLVIWSYGNDYFSKIKLLEC